jgi:pyruvate,water dikinase
MQKLLDVVGQERHSEAKDMVQLGRLSWKLRDDDNILVGRLESLLLEALSLAGQRLKQRGLLEKYEKLNDTAALILSDALLYPPDESIKLPQEKGKDFSTLGKQIGKPRQLTGQPASPGIASGSARIVHDSNDLKEFKFGEVLICDAIQPTMTHIVPLASAIVERRGGMLIHGAIIARELGIPCVNGVADAAELIEKGELVTVDGYLGIVTVGEAEFDLERSQGEEGFE